MTEDSKPPMFGPAFVLDPANHEPRSSKSALIILARQTLPFRAGKDSAQMWYNTFLNVDNQDIQETKGRTYPDSL
jgi:hypothetical protein